MSRHLTPGEKRTRAAAAAAVARAMAHTQPPAPPQPYDDPAWRVTPARAREIRLAIQETRRARP
jgi:hypothetical protein